jgi:hypothetical protein
MARRHRQDPPAQALGHHACRLGRSVLF